MKKGKFMLLALVVAIMMMGAGYAYWKEEIKVNTTVDTGKLEVKLYDEFLKLYDDLVGSSKLTGESDDLSLQGYRPPKVVNGKFTSGDIDIENNRILNITLNDMYPGSGFKVSFKIQNNGTMDAKIRNISFDGYNDALGEYLLLKQYNIEKLVKVKSGNDKWEPIKENSNLNIKLKDISFKKIEDKLDLAKGGVIRITYVFEVDRNATDSQFSEDTTYGFNVKADVLQFNDPNTKE